MFFHIHFYMFKCEHPWHSDQTNSAEPPGTLRHSDAGNPCGQGGDTTGGMELDDFQEGFCS